MMFDAVLSMITISLLLPSSDCREYCQFETFNASCLANQVVVIEEARYGRLQLGRCVTRDYGFLGCSANVLDLLDRTCSGHRSCQYNIPNLRDLVQPCPKDLTSYLEASYSCVNVFDRTNTRCNDTVFLRSSGPSVYIHISSNNTDGDPSSSAPPPPLSSTPPLEGTTTAFQPALTPSCPLHFSTHPGQRIDVILLSFARYSEFDQGNGADPGPQLRPCPLSVFVVDGERRQNLPLCQSRQRELREQQVYTTNGSSIGIFLSKPSIHKQLLATSGVRKPGVYLLQLQATGCPDLIPPTNGWTERFEDRVVVRCNYSQETWYLTCKGTTWIGTVTNCSEGLLVAIVIGIFLGILFGLAMLVSVFFFKRRHIQRQTPKLNALLGHAEENLLTSECEDYYARKVYPAIRQRASTVYSRTLPYPIPHQYHPDCQSQQQLLELHQCSTIPTPPPPPLLHSPCHSLDGALVPDSKITRKHVTFSNSNTHPSQPSSYVAPTELMKPIESNRTSGQHDVTISGFIDSRPDIVQQEVEFMSNTSRKTDSIEGGLNEHIGWGGEICLT